MLNFNVADSFPSGACGSLGCHSVAVAARGAGDNKNDDVENIDKVLLVSGIFIEKCCLGATLL